MPKSNLMVKFYKYFRCDASYFSQQNKPFTSAMQNYNFKRVSLKQYETSILFTEFSKTVKFCENLPETNRIVLLFSL